MTAIPTEDVFAGVYSLLQQLTPSPFVIASRRLQLAEEMSATQLPAVFQMQVSEATLYTMDVPVGIRYAMDWYVYALAPDMNSPSTSILNPLVDAVLNVIPRHGNAQVLTIDGVACDLGQKQPIQYFEGVLGDRAVARIPLELLVPWTV